jgi:hypothetical protein
MFVCSDPKMHNWNGLMGQLLEVELSKDFEQQFKRFVRDESGRLVSADVL